MKTIHKVFLFLFIVSGCKIIFADDGFDFSGALSDRSSGAAETQDAGGFDFSSNPQDYVAQALPAVTLGGKVKFDTRAYLDDPENKGNKGSERFPLKSVPDVTINIDHSGETADAEIKLNFSKDSIKTYYEDVIEEAVARVYLGNFILEGGKEKLVWGKGDKLHVLDNFLASDYTDFIYPDYIDRRLAVPMFRAIYNAPSGMFRAEAVYAPVTVADRFSDDGLWVPAAKKELSTAVASTAAATLVPLGGSITHTFLKQTAAANKLSSDNLMPDLYNLKYSQYGVRVTGLLGSLDWGLSYYYGRYKRPSVDSLKLVSYVRDYITNGGTSDLETGIDYDRLQVFGIEGAKVFGKLNTRFELAYNLTDDVAGDNSAVHNNSVAWVAGFDMDLPIHNLNVNVQETGAFILHGESIKNNGNYDVDRDSEDCYSNNKLSVNISDNFLHENLKTEILVVWGIERGDLSVRPQISYTVRTGIDLIASGMYIYCRDKDSEFYAWKDNSFVQAGIKYTF
ncbi:hypothetical protein HRI96_07220 [Treponema parvum]|uniref:Lipoprotein n=1 Tax=Treponema parvum TaxID=138851 RepID=A0A975ICH5_9SPIR|nr:hypothetical protein [Treponema parvum]QTQ12001.1 hypothetical protein HRI96_07220 [Treponema parvum]QTQ16022.1 hypothetical protein HXT04_04520 [Treponema parvum]